MGRRGNATAFPINVSPPFEALENKARAALNYSDASRGVLIEQAVTNMLIKFDAGLTFTPAQAEQLRIGYLMLTNAGKDAKKKTSVHITDATNAQLDELAQKLIEAGVPVPKSPKGGYNRMFLFFVMYTWLTT